MFEHESDERMPLHQTESRQPFWRSRFGFSVLAALGIAALLLDFEHRIHIFAGNGLLVLLLLGCVVMQLSEERMPVLERPENKRGTRCR